MNAEEQRWIEKAIDLCASASDRDVTLMLIRKQNSNDEADITVTNAASPNMIAAMNGNQEPDSSED